MVDPQMISVRVMESICKQKDDFALKGTLQTPIKSSPSKTTSNSQCGWFDKKRKSYFKKCRDPNRDDKECKSIQASFLQFLQSEAQWPVFNEVDCVAIFVDY